MQTNRLTWIDAAKGIGIFLVFLGHTTIPGNIFWYIFSFHMPLFFFLSGYLYNAQKHIGWKELLQSKFKKLIIPYFLFFAILFVYWLIIGRAIGDVQNLNVPISRILFEFSYASAYLKTPFAPLWFLFTLFWVEIMFFALQKNITKKLWLFIILLVIAVLGYVYSTNASVRPPWGLDIAFVAVLLYGLGYFFRQYKLHFSSIMKYVSILIVPILIFVGWQIASKNSRIDMMSNEYGVFYLFLAGAMAGIGAMIILAKIWPARLLQYLGKNSLFLFVFQFAALDIGKTLIKYFWPQFDLAAYGAKNIAIGLGLSIFAIGFLILILETYNLIKKITFQLKQ